MNIVGLKEKIIKRTSLTHHPKTIPVSVTEAIDLLNLILNRDMKKAMKVMKMIISGALVP